MAPGGESLEELSRELQVEASPARLADWLRGHWGIEALHHPRDTTLLRTPPRSASVPPTGPGQPAQPLAIGILGAHGHRNIAAALRRHGRDATRVLPLLGTTSP